MTRYTLHVPEQFNDGREIPGFMLDEIELDLVDMFGGYTRMSATGGWRADNGSTPIEPMQVYVVDSADPATLERLQRYAAHLTKQFEQDAIYLTRQEIETWLIEATPAREESKA